MAVEAKICGITRPEDAEQAALLGADRIGVILAWGPRLIDSVRAAEIVAAAGDVPVMGVIAGGTSRELMDLAGGIGLRGLQFHRDADPVVAADLRAAGLEVWRVALIRDHAHVSRQIAAARIGADRVLVEPLGSNGSGGQGVALDMSLATRARECLPDMPMVLAGGLLPETVAEAIRVVGPDAVDVSSGVESSPGIKDISRLRRFLEAVRDAGPTA